uniref:Uncharacterized protein n=1 Tax=Trypanosoma congolense (strain IL3000) TaxID=1068625 RepID=G0USN1_TRYCI|nr:conserved hypothetical protein [Trypanosoma congolense IL3000]
MSTRGRVVPGPRETVPPPPSRTPTRYSSVCRVPTDRFCGGHRAPTCAFQRNQRATTDPCCTPVWTEGTERSPVPLAPTFVPHPSHPFFTDMRTPSPQQPVYPLARNRHPGSSHQPTRMASYRSWDESMRSANPESLHVDPYPRSPGISRAAAASEVPLPRYQDCVPTAQQRTMESQELRSIVAGTELLPQMPLLQGTHQTAKERGRTTLECFFKKQTTDTTPEVLDFLKEYRGRELELCDALNMALKDSNIGSSVNSATTPITLCTPKPRREVIPQPYGGFAPAKLGERGFGELRNPIQDPQLRSHRCQFDIE